MDFPYLPEQSARRSEHATQYDLLSLHRAWEEGEIIQGKVERCERDLTLTVRLGELVCRCPREEIAMGEVRDIAAITRVGKTAVFQVMSVGQDGSVVLSRRLAQEQCAARYLSTLRPGDIIPGCVTHLEQFGAFVDIGCGIVALLSIDCISVSRISHPRERLAVGQEILTVVKSIDGESGRINLTHRELLGTWEENAERFAIGQTVPGIVRSVEDYGVFVELTPNLAGLAEYRGDVSPGMGVSVYIKNIIPDRMKLKLVIIDRLHTVTDGRRMEYRLPRDGKHIDRWCYSPTGCARQILSDFREENRGNM